MNANLANLFLDASTIVTVAAGHAQSLVVVVGENGLPMLWGDGEVGEQGLGYKGWHPRYGDGGQFRGSRERGSWTRHLEGL